MNATKFRLGEPNYNGDDDFYYVLIDYRWYQVVDFFSLVAQGRSTFSDYKRLVRILSELSTSTDDQQAIFIGDYCSTEDGMRTRGWLIPQWDGLIGKTITKARTDSTPYMNFEEQVAPIIAAMRTSTTIYYDKDGNQTLSSADDILITVDIHGFTLDTDRTLTSYPSGYTMQGSRRFISVENYHSQGVRFVAMGGPMADDWCFSEGNYVTCETYDFDKLISGIASSITADISKRFVQR